MAEPYAPSGIQANAHAAFLLDDYKRGVLYWSRRCFAKGSLVTLASGVEIPIEEVQPGMFVVSYNPTLGIAEPKEVLSTHCFGLDEDPKPMIEFTINDTQITASYDHEFYSNGAWVPIYQLTWGAMAPSQRLQLQLLCEQYGQTLDDPSSWRVQDSGNETSTRQFWLLQDSPRRQDSQSSPSSRSHLGNESTQQTSGKSHRQCQDKQSDKQSRVGNESRKRSSYDESGQTDQKLRREVRNPHTIGETGARDTRISESQSSDEQAEHEQGFSPEISSLFRVNPPHFKGYNLGISAVRVRENQESYDLEIADNNNYVISKVLVHNTGKTLWSVQHLMLSCILNQGPHHIVFKEYQQAETVAWNQYLHTIPPELIDKLDKSTLTITFKHINGSVKFPWGTVQINQDTKKPPSTIRLLGSDKADSHRGGESLGMIFDEFQDQDKYQWDTVYKPFFATTNGWACFMGTAKDKDWWNNFLENAENNPRWYFSKSTWRGNPLVKPEWVEAERKEAEKEGTLGQFLQEMELIPFSQQGAVYPDYTEEIHVVNPEDIPDEGTEYIALDFGFAEGHPMAACFIRITRDDIWYQWDEIHDTGIQMDDLIAEIRVKLGGRQLAGIIADSARPDLIDYLASKGFPVIPSPKKANSILSGIELLRLRLKPKIQIIGPPKPNYYISRVCRKTRYDWKHYAYKEPKPDRHPTELPEKKYDDSLDAIRYLALFFKYGHPKDDKIIESSLLKETNSYGLL